MADTTYVDQTTVITSDTMNDINRLLYTILGDPADLAALLLTLRGLELGQCRLAYASATSLLLSRHNGRYLFVNGAFVEIPGAGVSLGVGSLSASTTYFIYAYMSGATMTLEASATAHATDATYGHQIKSADATRTLVGTARTNAATQWDNSATKIHVLSYFNRRNITAVGVFAADYTTGSVSPVEISTTIRVEFLSWADDAVLVSAEGAARNDSTGSITYTYLVIDGTGWLDCGVGSQNTATYHTPFGLSLSRLGLTGNHYATLGGAVSSNNGDWTRLGVGPTAAHLRVTVRG